MKAVVITGVSRGIGKVTAEYLAQRGYYVFAGVRKETDGQQVKSDRIHPLMLDILDKNSIAESAKAVEAVVGKNGLSALINNAGLAIPLPVETIALDDLYYQLNINVVAQIAVTQAFLPLIRKAKGRIVNVNSIFARIVAPLSGPYSASKFALEALTDALRLELYDEGIKVISIQPGAVATDFAANAKLHMERSKGSHEGLERYEQWIAAEQKRQEQSVRHQQGIAPEKVAATMYHALKLRNPKTRYLVGQDARIIAFLRHLLLDQVVDHIVLAVR
jgi:NAD(P)-dependent dehydrogenase (short-subunit alcohol dehydrogenase family)